MKVPSKFLFPVSCANGKLTITNTLSVTPVKLATSGGSGVIARKRAPRAGHADKYFETRKKINILPPNYSATIDLGQGKGTIVVSDAGLAAQRHLIEAVGGELPKAAYANAEAFEDAFRAWDDETRNAARCENRAGNRFQKAACKAKHGAQVTGTALKLGRSIGWNMGEAALKGIAKALWTVAKTYGETHKIVSEGNKLLKSDRTITVATSYAELDPGLAAADLISLINAERAQLGCRPLTASGLLSKNAGAHSQDMAATSQYSSVGSDGRSAIARLNASGYQWQTMAELYARNQPTAQAVMTGWKIAVSPTAREVVRDCTFREVGVGLAYSASGEPFWTATFAIPMRCDVEGCWLPERGISTAR